MAKRYEIKLNSTENRLSKIYDHKQKRQRFVKDAILVKFKKNARKSDIDRYALKHNLVIEKKLNNYLYVFKLRNPELEQLLAIVDDTQTQEFNENQNEEEEIIESKDIDEFKFVSGYGKIQTRKIKNVTASMENDQWYLHDPKSGININEAWSYTKGTGVKVAVIDSGLDTDHPDINLLIKGYNAQTGSSNAEAVAKSNENHGTAVAGLIAGKDDNAGIVGVAPEAQIIPIKLYGDDGIVRVSQIIQAHQKAIELGATIINNSWGSFDPSVATGQAIDISQQEKDMYESLATEANDGKGVVVIFAAGNSARKDPSFNNSPEARLRSNFAVGAINVDGQRSYYSVYGDELALVAPGGDAQKAILTTDRQDLAIKSGTKVKKYVLGYDRGSYTASFSGTSAAAPIVAGVAALVWSVNPNLSADDVKQILKDSARKPNTYDFNEGGRNNELGSGIVDAGEAVKKALNY